jgi:hypothetical protein
MMLGRAAAAALVAAVLVAAELVSLMPAAAQQVATSGASAMRQRPLLLQLPLPDFGSPPAAGPRLAAGPDQSADCAPAWPCRLRLFGFTGKYGGVGLKGAALTW